jgi:hypothetical protein
MLVQERDASTKLRENNSWLLDILKRVTCRFKDYRKSLSRLTLKRKNLTLVIVSID